MIVTDTWPDDRGAFVMVFNRGGILVMRCIIPNVSLWLFRVWGLRFHWSRVDWWKISFVTPEDDAPVQ